MGSPRHLPVRLRHDRPGSRVHLRRMLDCNLMKSFSIQKSGIYAASVLVSIFFAGAQTPPVKEAQGMPHRATPADYQAAAQVGTVTIAAEFTGHSVPTMQGPLTTDDYVIVETAFFGPADAKLKLSFEDFALRINGKKVPSPGQPYGAVLSSLKDPEWEATIVVEKKSKGGLGTGGGGDKGDSTPAAPPKMPIEMRRAMDQRVKKSTLLEGDRSLPQAGLIFFQYRGKTTNIQTLELIYNGPAGKTSIALLP